MNATNAYVTNILSGYFFTNTFKYAEVHHWWTEPLPAWLVFTALALALCVRPTIQYAVNVIKTNSWRFKSKP